MSLDGLERDGGDRAAALVVGVAQALGVVHEVLVDRGREVGGVAGPLEGLADPLAGAGERLDPDLLLAAREVVVHGPSGASPSATICLMPVAV